MEKRYTVLYMTKRVIYDKNDLILGADLPVNHAGHQMVASFDKQFLYDLVNGYHGDGKNIYKYSCSGTITNCRWTMIGTKAVQAKRYYSVAFPITNYLAKKLCK